MKNTPQGQSLAQLQTSVLQKLHKIVQRCAIRQHLITFVINKEYFSTPSQILIWNFLLKLLTTLNSKLFQQKDPFQMCHRFCVCLRLRFLRFSTFFTNNKRTISRFFGTMTPSTQPAFHLFKVNARNTKNTKARCEMCLKIIVRTPERSQ